MNLQKIGNLRAAALYHLHTIWCDPQHHRLCFQCANRPIEDLAIETKVVQLSQQKIESFLENLNKVNGLNWYELSEQDSTIMTGLKFDNLREMALLSEVDLGDDLQGVCFPSSWSWTTITSCPLWYHSANNLRATWACDREIGEGYGKQVFTQTKR